jgi:hypothetical protein
MTHALRALSGCTILGWGDWTAAQPSSQCVVRGRRDGRTPLHTPASAPPHPSPPVRSFILLAPCLSCPRPTCACLLLISNLPLTIPIDPIPGAVRNRSPLQTRRPFSDCARLQQTAEALNCRQRRLFGLSIE